MTVYVFIYLGFTVPKLTCWSRFYYSTPLYPTPKEIKNKKYIYINQALMNLDRYPGLNLVVRLKLCQTEKQ